MTLPEPCDHPELFEQNGICALCEEFFGQTDCLEMLKNHDKNTRRYNNDHHANHDLY